MSFSIRFIDVITTRTSTRRVTRINCDHGYAYLLCFVFDKGSELSESPTGKRCSLRLPSRYPVANPCQIFQGYPAISALSRSNNCFTNIVIGPGSKALFFLASLLEQTTRRLRAFGLKLASKLAVAITNIFNCLTLVNRLVAINGDVGNTEIDAQEPFNVQRVRLINVADSEQIKLAINTSQIGFALLGLQQSPLVFTANKRDYLSSVHCPDRNRATWQTPVEHSIIVSNAAEWLESAKGFLVQLISVSHFGDATNNNLSSKIELFSDRMVNKLVKRELTEGFLVPRLLTDLITSSVSRLKSDLEQISLGWGGLQLYFCR